MKAQLYYFNKRTNKIARTHDQIYRDTKYITRANDSTKIIGNKNTRHLLTKLVEDLATNNNKVIYVSHEEITEFTECGEKQNKNILAQLADIFVYRYIRKKAKFEIKYTHDGLARVTNPNQFYAVKNEKISGKNANKNFHLEAKKFPCKRKKISSSTLYNIETKEKELEKIPYRYIFSNSVLNVETIEQNTNNENASLSTQASTLPTKPRIRIVAAMSERTQALPQEQSDLLCYPEGAASQPCSTKNESSGLVGISDKLNKSGQPETLAVNRRADSHNAISDQSIVIPIDPSTSTLQETQIAKSAKVLPLTASQEREHYRNHQGRDTSSQADFTSITEIFTLANLLSPIASSEPVHIDQQAPSTIKEEDAMKAYDWDNPANKLDLAIMRNFDTNTAQELTIHIGYDYIATEHKMRLVFKKNLAISEHNKNLLKQLIKDIYGDKTEIVIASQNAKKADVVKISRTQEKFSSNEQNPPEIDDFSKKPLIQKVIKNLIEDRIEKVLIDRWFNSNKMKISESENRITFEASDVVVDQIINKFQSSLTQSCKEFGLELIFLAKNRFDEIRETKITEQGKW